MRRAIPHPGYTAAVCARHWLLVAALLATCAPASAPPTALAAGTIVVTSTAGTRGGPDCTLRDALTAANNDAPSGGCPAGSGADTIVLAQATYTLTEADAPPVWLRTNGLPAVTGAVTIEGNAATIQNGRSVALFTVLSSGNLTLKNLTVRGGLTGIVLPGGGIGPRAARQVGPPDCAAYSGNISNCGTLTLINSTVTEGMAMAGGGIWNTGGVVTIENSAINVNTTVPDGGGGIFNNGGSVRLSGSQVFANRTTTGGSAATAVANGAGILSLGGSLELNASSLSFNQSEGEGGGIYVTGALSVTNSSIGGNSAVGDGGGIYSAGTTALRSSTLTGNMADGNSNGFGDGGGLYVASGTTHVANTIIAQNRDTSTNAGPGNLYPDATSDNGARLAVTATVVPTDTYPLLDDPFLICVQGPSFQLPNCQAVPSDFIFMRIPITWRNLIPGTYTVTQNNQDVRWRLSGAPAVAPVPVGATVAITTSSEYQPYLAFVPALVAPVRPGGPQAGLLQAGARQSQTLLVSAGYNLIGDGSGSPFVDGEHGDIVGSSPLRIDPQLAMTPGAGMSQTYMLLPGSPAIDQGNPAPAGSVPAACPNADQRGVARPQGPRCDIGAYELAPASQ